MWDRPGWRCRTGPVGIAGQARPGLRDRPGRDCGTGPAGIAGQARPEMSQHRAGMIVNLLIQYSCEASDVGVVFLSLWSLVWAYEMTVMTRIMGRIIHKILELILFYARLCM